MTILPKNFSIKSWKPTQKGRKRETTGATYVWVNDVLNVKKSWHRRGRRYFKIVDVYGKVFSMTEFVVGATKKLERHGKL